MSSNPRELAAAMKEQQREKLNSIYRPMTEEIRLPSGGAFYPSGGSSVTIRPMTAREEDILSNEKLLRSGRAFDELIKSCVIEWNGIDYADLLVGDKNAIMMAIRTVSLGDEYEVQVTCPHCSTKSTLNLSITNDFHPKGFGAEPTSPGTNMFRWTSPKGIDFLLRLPQQRDLENIASERKKKKAMLKEKFIETPIADFLLSCIVEVQGITDKFEIQELLISMGSIETRAIVDFIKLAAPDYDMKYTFECYECEEASEVTVPLTVGFFWPDRRPRP